MSEASSNNTLLQFPCDFPLKIIGKNTKQLIEDVFASIRLYYPETEEHHLRTQISQQKTYVSISVILKATDKKTLDDLYIALTAHPDIHMVL